MKLYQHIMINYVVRFLKNNCYLSQKKDFSMDIFEWKDQVSYNLSYGRIVRLSVILAELYHVNASCKFKAKSLEQLAKCLELFQNILNFGLNESHENILEGLHTVLGCIHNLYF
jgi:hypothetical protein